MVSGESLKNDYGFYEEKIGILEQEVNNLDEMLIEKQNLHRQQLLMLKQILTDQDLHSVNQVDIALEFLEEII